MSNAQTDSAVPTQPRRPLSDHFSPGGQLRLDMDSDEEITHVAIQQALADGDAANIPDYLKTHRRWIRRYRRSYRAAYLSRPRNILATAPDWPGMAETGETIVTSIGEWS